jgi:hypothetical protein
MASSLCAFSDYDLERPEVSPRQYVVAVSRETGSTATMGEEPRWKHATVISLAKLLSLPDGWDSYGARTIERTAINWAVHVLEASAANDTPAPTVVPTSSGGVQLEWHDHGVDIELELLPSGAQWLSFEDLRGGQGWEGSLGSDLAPLGEAVKLLTQRARESNR